MVDGAIYNLNDAVYLDGGNKTLKVSIKNEIPSDKYLYQWYKNELEIEGATEASYVVENSGRYFVKITNNYNTDLAYLESNKFNVFE
jgi:hypothetical protein